MSILSILAVLGAAFWYYRTAQRLGKPPIAFALLGVLVYYAGFWLWMHEVLGQFLGSHFKRHDVWIGIGMDLSAIAIGLLGVWLLKIRILDRSGAGSS